MLVSIGNYNLCDGTRSGGVGTSGLRFRVERAIQVFAPLRAVDPQTFDRAGRKVTLSFSVARTHASQDAADVFVLEHEDTLPSSGIVTITARKPNGQTIVRYVPNGKITDHQLDEQIGVTTRHSYTLVGGRPTSVKPAA